MGTGLKRSDRLRKRRGRKHEKSKTFRRAKSVLWKIVGVLAVLGIWQGAIEIFHIKKYVLPSPLLVFKSLFDPAMAAKNKFLNAMKMPSIDDMFSSEADRQRESGDLVTEVPLSDLHPFVGHPFEVRDDEDMQ